MNQSGDKALPQGLLSAKAKTYFVEMERCIRAKAHWALLHMVVCLPDFCAGLQSRRGNTCTKMFINWCDRYLRFPDLTGEELYLLRCKVLHRGHAATSKFGRYLGFVLRPRSPELALQPRDNVVLMLDIEALAEEMKCAIERWIDIVEKNPAEQVAIYVHRNLRAAAWNDPVVPNDAFPDLPVLGQFSEEANPTPSPVPYLSPAIFTSRPATAQEIHAMKL
ncbi:MAG TPA: hypothetical protein VHB46_09270 [Burkholderiales bacterium]|nr:hypothetical protein [Burkholderiales bacterium]